MSDLLPPAQHHVALNEDSGKRLDVFLAERCPDLSRSQLRQLIDGGQVRVQGDVPTKAGHRVRGGDVVELVQPASPASTASPEPIPLDIRHEDESLLVVSKPAGLVVHPSPGHPSGTLVNGLLHHAASLLHVGDPMRPGIVHRLDKDTSGLLMVAKTPMAHAHLAAQLRDRVAKRMYVAVVCGTRLDDQGTFSTDFGRHPTDRLRFSSRHGGERRATTHFRVLLRSDLCCLVGVRLETGRTHQIRVHFSDAGHPIAGDELYGWPRDAGARSHRELRILAATRRHALHAAGLRFVHPVTGAPMAFSDRVPDDLAPLVTGLFGDEGWLALDELLSSWSSTAPSPPRQPKTADANAEHHSNHALPPVARGATK